MDFSLVEKILIISRAHSKANSAQNLQLFLLPLPFLEASATKGAFILHEGAFCILLMK